MDLFVLYDGAFLPEETNYEVVLFISDQNLSVLQKTKSEDE